MLTANLCFRIVIVGLSVKSVYTQDNSTGRACALDDACTETSWGCECDFTDDSWVDNVASNATSSSTAASSTIMSSVDSSTAAASTTIAPFCTPYQDPHAGSSYCSCNDGNEYSMTSGSNPCPYTSPAPSGLLITSTSQPEAAATSIPEAAATTDEPTPTVDAASSTTSEAIQASESCHTQYKALYDAFTIHGTGWDADKLNAGGSPGQGLHDQIKGCVGSISKWSYTEDVDGWDFEATGHTTIWQKSCIQNAMVSAGSPSRDCSGSG